MWGCDFMWGCDMISGWGEAPDFPKVKMVLLVFTIP